MALINYRSIILVIMLSAWVVSIEPHVRKEPNSGLILNIITGGKYERLNHIGDTINHYHPNLTSIVKAVTNVTCGQTTLLEVLNKVLNQQGLIDIDLRTILLEDEVETGLSKSLSDKDVTDITKIVNNSLLVKADNVARSSHAQSPYSYTRPSSDLVSGKAMVDVFTGRGPNISSINKMANNLNQMFSEEPVSDKKALQLYESRLKYYTDAYNYHISKFSSFDTINSTLRSPSDVCEAYLKIRGTMNSTSSRMTLSLAKVLRDALSALIDILKLKDHLHINQEHMQSDGVVDGDYIKADNFDVTQIYEFIHSEKYSIDLDLMRLTKLQRFLTQQENNILANRRVRRSIQLITHVSDGQFTGHLGLHDQDLVGQLGPLLTHPKLHIAMSSFSPSYWPECKSIPEAVTSILRSHHYDSILYLSFSLEGLCFVIRFCHINARLNVDLFCEPITLQTKGLFTNIDNLVVSDYIHKLGNIEMDSSLSNKLESYCMIGDMKISNCDDYIISKESFSIGRVAGDWMILRNDLDIGYVLNQELLTSYDCTASNISDLYDPNHPGYIHGCKHGDQNYIKRFSGSKDCSCSISDKSGELTVKYYNKLLPMDFLIHATVEVKTPIRSPKKQLCIDCRIFCKDGEVDLTNNPKYDLLSLCKYGHCEYHKILMQKQKIILNDAKALSGELDLKLYPNNTEQEAYAQKIICEVSDICKLIKCLLCRDFIFNPRCHPVHAIIIWSLILIIPLVIIKIISSLLTGVFKIIRWLIKLLMGLWSLIKLLLGVCSKFTKSTTTMAYDSLRDYDSIEMGQVLEQQATISSRPKSQSKIYVRPIQNFSLIIMICLIPAILHLVSPCAFESIIQSESIHCSDTGGTHTCTIHHNAQISVAPIGQISCLNVMRYDSNRVSSQIQIKTRALRLLCNPSSHYYTATTNPSISTMYRCPSAGHCTEEYCKEVKQLQYIPDMPNKAIFNITGESGCRLVNGFWGNSCLLASSACKFYRVFYPPSGDTYEVFDCPTWDWLADIEITVVDTNPKFKSILLSTGQPYVADDLIIRLISVSTKPSFLFNKCFLKKANMKYDGFPISINECNRQTEAVIGKVGEIQCPTSNDADLMSLKCSILRGLSTVTVNGNDIIFKPKVLNIDEIYQGSLLPKQFPGMMLKNTREGTPYFDTTEASLFTLNLELKNYKVTIQETDIECGTSFVNISGCYKCESGARTCFDSTASRYPAIARLICPGIIPQLTTIRTNGKWCLNIPFHQESINLVCTISCGMKDQSITIEGLLIYQADKIVTYSNHTQMENDVSEAFGTSLFRWVTSLSWPSYLMLICSLFLGIILLYIVFGILLPMVLMLIKRSIRRNHHNSHKHTKHPRRQI